MTEPRECDAAELPQASTDDHPAEHLIEAYCPRCNRAVDASCPRCGSHVEGSAANDDANLELKRQEFYRRFLTMLQNSRNTKFTIGCYLIATGDAYADGETMSQFAKRWGVCRATVSKHCVQICAMLKLPPSAYMRNLEMAAKFKASNRRPKKL